MSFQIKLFPCPTKNQLNLEIDKSIQMQTIEIYTIQGQILKTILNAEKVSSIDVFNLNKGTYFIKITTDKGSLFSKFLKD